MASPQPKSLIFDLEVSLMKDQVDGLLARNVQCAATLNDLLAMPERAEVLEKIQLGDVGILLVSPYGTVVLEAKNMSGWIFGSEKQAQWTQKLYKRNFKFQNPLRQNFKHLEALEATLASAPSTCFRSSTSSAAASPKLMPANVTQRIGFIHYIQFILAEGIQLG